MIDWIQVLLAGAGAGIGGAISAQIRSHISGVEKRAYRVILIVLSLALYMTIGILSAIFFSENARMAAAARSFAMFGAVSIFVYGKKPLRNKAKSGDSKLAAEPKNEFKKHISGFGCYKVYIDPRDAQTAGLDRTLYFFVDGFLGVSDTHLIFTNEHPIHGDIFRKETEFRQITDIEWYPYDKNAHEDEDEKARYLVRGLFRFWMEVGYFWLPGGSSTEMECTISYFDGTESYFYFKRTPGNIKSIGEIREYVLTAPNGYV